MEKKKILIITGSPRPEGNTNTLCKAFTYGAIAAGHEVEIFDAASCNMQGCHADQSCFERGCCGIQDDGVRLNELMRWANILVLSSPVYWKGFTSQIKRVIDRFYQFSAPKGRATCTVKKTFLISACASPDLEMFDEIRKEYQHINHLLKFESVGEILVPGLEGKDDIKEKTEVIEETIKAGYSVGEKKEAGSIMRQHKEGCWFV